MDEVWRRASDLMHPSLLEPLFYGLALAACLYTLLAIFSLRRFPRARRFPVALEAPGVTVLKPLYGAEKGLYDHLASFCRQDYAGPVQILFGLHDEDDAAAPVAHRVVEDLRLGRIDGARHDLTAEVVIDPTQHGANGKVSNLINLTRHIQHDVVVLADSDISVAPDYLNRLAVALRRPGVGLVTCLYRGLPLAGLWSRLGAMGVDYHFLPNVVTGVRLNLANPCIGATIALRRTTLQAIGGFWAIKDQLADDYVLGEAVRELGLKTVLADFAVIHAHSESSFIELWRRDMRWARTIRSLDPLGYIGTATTFPLAWALAALIAGGFSASGAVLTVAALISRLTLQDEVDQRFAGQAHALWLSPLRDLLSFAIFIGSFLPGRLFWRGNAFEMGEDGVMAPIGETLVAPNGEPAEATETEVEAA